MIFQPIDARLDIAGKGEVVQNSLDLVDGLSHGVVPGRGECCVLALPVVERGSINIDQPCRRAGTPARPQSLNDERGLLLRVIRHASSHGRKPLFLQQMLKQNPMGALKAAGALRGVAPDTCV
jgi:hypothetical protein